MFCQCVHALGLLKSCHMLSSVPKSVTHLSFRSPPLSLYLYLSILYLCRCGRTDCCSVTSTALTFQLRRIRWQFHIPLSLSLPLSLGCDTFSFPIPDSAFILYPSFSPSFHLILFYLSVSQPCLTFPALIGRRKFYWVWWLVWRR